MKMSLMPADGSSAPLCYTGNSTEDRQQGQLMEIAENITWIEVIRHMMQIEAISPKKIFKNL